MFDYKEYEQEYNKIHSDNDEYLKLFKADLISSGLSANTIHKHLSNVEFYLNDYLLHVELCTMEDGIEMLDMFLGNFYIHKCMWSTSKNIKNTVASLKKFYKCMFEHNKISKYKYAILRAEVKLNIEKWQSYSTKYNKPFLF